MTDSATLATIIQANRIQALLRGSHLPVPVFMDLAWGLPIGPGVGSSISIPSVTGIETNSGTKTEGAEFGLVATSTTNQTLTPGYVGHADQVTDEASYDAQEDAMAIVVEKGMEALMDRVDSDFMALGATAANGSDFTDEAFTDDAFIDSQTAYLAQNPHKGMHAAVLGGFQIRDLKISLKDNGNASWGADAASMRMQQLLSFGAQGYQGELYGQPVFRSGNTVDFASNNAGFMTKMGTGGIAYGVWEFANVEYRRVPRSTLWELTLKIRYGLAIADSLNLHTMTSRSLAA